MCLAGDYKTSETLVPKEPSVSDESQALISYDVSDVSDKGGGLREEGNRMSDFLSLIYSGDERDERGKKEERVRGKKSIR